MRHQKQRKIACRNLIKTFDPKSYYFHQIKQASGLVKIGVGEQKLFCRRWKSKERGRATKRTEVAGAKTDDKSLMNYDIIWFFLFDKFKPHGASIIHRFAINVIGLNAVLSECVTILSLIIPCSWGKWCWSMQEIKLRLCLFDDSCQMVWEGLVFFCEGCWSW